MSRRKKNARRASPDAQRKSLIGQATLSWFIFFVLSVVVFVADSPAINGGLIWNDKAHVTKPELRAWHGLARIWFELGATQQYYPLLHSAFWIEHKLWGDSVVGYHLMNIAQHLCAAGLLLLILKKLRIPGAELATAIFALHPINVESVAWISEQKNTLSAVFYMGACLLYLDFDERRSASKYLWASVLFILGLLTKTVVATLPAATATQRRKKRLRTSEVQVGLIINHFVSE
jgi:protein O-mannosyl-transferase